MKITAIADNTFREGVRQPVYLLVLVLVMALLGILYFLPFFTLGNDIQTMGEVRMYKDVCLAFILTGLLVTVLLLASKVVSEEIESRTTLTLMSKPVRRWELIVGKFAGVMMAVTLALAILGAVLVLATYLRIPDDIRISADTYDEGQAQQLADARHMHVMSLLPALTLIWLQLAVMAAISVAFSTRVGLVPNMVIGIALFLVAHLTPFLADAAAGRSQVQRKLAGALVLVLPYLENFNLNNVIIYKDMVFGGGPVGPGQIAYVRVWELVGLSAGYAGAYVAAALLVAMALFRTRELG